VFEAPCPCCGKPIRGLESTVERGVPWYRLARETSSHCPQCKAELRLGRVSRHLSGAHQRAYLAILSAGLLFADRSQRADWLGAGILVMIVLRLLYLFTRGYVPAARRAESQGGG